MNRSAAEAAAGSGAAGSIDLARGQGGRIGVGIDLVEVSQIAESLRLFPERFARRLFTPAEVEDCARFDARAPERFAARFAAKEAAMKALGITEGVDWRELEVIGPDGGACALVLHGEVARRAGPCTLALTVGLAGDLATAVVLAERPYATRASASSVSCSSAAAPSARGIEQTHCESNPP